LAGDSHARKKLKLPVGILLKVEAAICVSSGAWYYYTGTGDDGIRALMGLPKLNSFTD
jgi:hypothetical protein